MDFTLNEEQKMVQQAARDFAQTELLPGVIERDEKQQFPAEAIRKMAELGFLGMMVDPAYGGSGLDTLSYVLVMEELSKVDASASVVVIVGESTADKIVIAQSVKRLNPNARLVIVTNSTETLGQFSAVHPDLVFSPGSVAARGLANLLMSNSIH